jgi:hypothetical protein
MSYTYSKVDDLDDAPLVGSHQCVALVQHYAGAPVTALWRQGEHVVDSKMLRKGTAIATFVNGRYPNHSHGNHAALFLRQSASGIWIMDQWKGDKKKTISSRFIPSRGMEKNGRFNQPSDNADAFYVIE